MLNRFLDFFISNRKFIKSPTPEATQKLPSIFKHSTPILSRCEATFADCYRLLLGKKSPKMVIVYDTKSGDILGVSSEEIPGFVDFHTLQKAANWNQQKELSTDSEMLSSIAKKHGELLDHVTGNIKLDHPEFVQQLAEVLVSAYFFEEDDLHKLNFGIDSDSMPRHIDFGMNFFGTIFAKTNQVRIVSALTAANVSWKISERDIVNFPVLTDSQPWYWPTIDSTTKPNSLSILLGKDKLFTAEDVTLFSGLAKNSDFITAKYRCFLKLLLIPERSFREIFTAHFSPGISAEVDSLKNALIVHLRKRLETLQETLCQIPEFQKFLTKKDDTKIVIEELITELQLEHTESTILKESIHSKYESLFQTSQNQTIQPTFTA